MKNFIIIEGADVTAQDIDEAIKLDRLVYDEEYYVTLQQCLEWNQRNNRIYTMVRDERSGKIVAYVNISPVTNEYYEKIRSGSFIDTYLPAEAIVDYAIPDLYSLYFSSIVVHPDYQNSAVFLTLFNAITRKFIDLGNEEILVKRMVADAVSDKGIKFCEMFGMQKQKNSDHDSDIYEVEMLPPRFRIASKATRTLYSYYQEKARELGLEQTGPAAPAQKNTITKEPQRKADKPMSAAKVFISYSSNELEIAGQVCEYLEQNGISCWIAPRNINPGGNYATQIVHAIRDCSVLVLLASESTNRSGHVSNEVSLAFDNKKVIIPFKLEDLIFSDEYLYFLGRKHWIEAHKDMKAGLIQLLETVRHLIPAQTVKTTSQPAVSMPSAAPRKEAPISATQERAFDKSQEIAEADYTREEIANRILQRASKSSSSQIPRFRKAGEFEILKEYANQFLKQTYSVHRYNRPKDVDCCIDYLVEEILGDEDAEVIKISGLPGTGKSVLMQSAFYQVMQEFLNGTSQYLPFYIALGYYEKARYDSDSIYDQVKALMTKEMAEFFTYIRKNPDVTPIVFIDEIREHNIGKIALENVLMDLLKPHNIQKRVVAIDSGLIKSRNKIKRIIPIVSEKVSALFESHVVDSHDEEEAKRFIENVTAFYDYDISADEVFSVIKRLKYQEIDAFIVRSIADELLSSPEEIESISDMYEKWALTELYGDEQKLLDISRTSFEYMFKRDFPIESINFNDPLWTLIHNHESYIDMLISYYLIQEIDRCDNYADFNCDLFRIMLTASTDMFLGSFLKDNYELQEKIYHIIVSNYDQFEAVQKSSATFWLAKLTYKTLVSDAVQFLRVHFDRMKNIVKCQDNTSQANYDDQFYFRALSFSLVVFGQTSVLDTYLCLLITNDSANAINRGAIIEYYGDQYQMAENDTYYLDTDIKIGDRAIKALTWKLNKALRPGSNDYPEIDLVTICTLLQMRIQTNDSRKIPQIRAWVSDVLTALRKYKMRPQNIKSEKIQFYLNSVSDDFKLFLQSKGRFDISQIIYNTLRNLKNIKRKQWETKRIDDPESVSEHLYSSWMLAMLFLPEELNHEDYSKREVLDMLLIHDMAEAQMGDQVLDLNEPSKELRPQNEIMRKLMVKGSYPNIANLTYYYNVWTGYYKGININSKIARDINLIQSVYTFCEYFCKHAELFTEEDKERWINEKNNLETDVGYSIYEKLVENNLDFAGVFNDTIEAGRESRRMPREPRREASAVSAASTPRARAAAPQPQAGEIRVVGYDDLMSSHMDIDTIKTEILSMVSDFLSPDGSDSLEDNLSMLESISENWRVLLDQNDDPVGYWVFVALQEDQFATAKAGALDERDITLDTIEYIDFPGTYKGYLLSSGVKPEVRTASLVQTLYKSLAQHFQDLAQRGIFFDEICAVAESPTGMSAMRKLGMHEICPHDFGGKVFACELTHMSENRYFSTFKELAALYDQYFN